MYFLLKMGMFHCYVSLPEGSFFFFRKKYKTGASSPGEIKKDLYNTISHEFSYESHSLFLEMFSIFVGDSCKHMRPKQKKYQ